MQTRSCVPFASQWCTYQHSVLPFRPRSMLHTAAAYNQNGASCSAWSHGMVGICSHSVWFALQGNKEVKRDRLCAVCECSRCRQCPECLGWQHLSGALAAHLAGQKSPCPCSTSRKGKLTCDGVAHVKRVKGITPNLEPQYPCRRNSEFPGSPTEIRNFCESSTYITHFGRAYCNTELKKTPGSTESHLFHCLPKVSLTSFPRGHFGTVKHARRGTPCHCTAPQPDG